MGEKEFETTRMQTIDWKNKFLKELPNQFTLELKRLSKENSYRRLNPKSMRDGGRAEFTEKELRVMESAWKYEDWVYDNWTKTFRSGINVVEFVEHKLDKPHKAWDFCRL